MMRCGGHGIALKLVGSVLNMTRETWSCFALFHTPAERALGVSTSPSTT